MLGAEQVALIARFVAIMAVRQHDRGIFAAK
jgi:hypothetical protein